MTAKSMPKKSGATSESAGLTYKEAASRVLREQGPMHYRALTDAILARGLVRAESATPAATVNSVLAVDVARKGSKSIFVRIEPGVFGLRELHGDPETPGREDSSGTGKTSDEPTSEGEQRVRIPYFPTYRDLRQLLRIWPGRSRKQLLHLRTTLFDLTGTPQQTVDWTDPDAWIPERLEGNDREMAHAIWVGSKKTINPRHMWGNWLLAQHYGLVRDDAAGLLELTDFGREFLENEQGKAEVEVDDKEGVFKVLEIVAENGPARAGGLVDEWTSYLKGRSRYGTDATIKYTLRLRLNNLVDRGFVQREGNLYSATPSGLAYLEKAPEGQPEGSELWALIRKQDASVRESLRELLLDMDPYAFEHLVKRLLQEMDYQNVEVTSRSGDGGVDVVGDIELGITSVREVVQVKRHRRTIQRKDLDALRGSLYRFNAVRGTIVTTANFAKGTVEAAFANGAAPITLIDGDKLINLLIEYGIGVHKKTIELMEIDRSAFTEAEGEG